jgi:hypothetical protein
MLVMQQIPLAWKRDEAALRRFVEAALWICRTGAPWRDLPQALGPWSSVYHRWRRWCLRGWWELVSRRSARPCPLAFMPAGKVNQISPAPGITREFKRSDAALVVWQWLPYGPARDRRGIVRRSFAKRGNPAQGSHVTEPRHL